MIVNKTAAPMGDEAGTAEPSFVQAGWEVCVLAAGNNAVRWSPGERLQHLFEDRCDEFERLGRSGHLAVDSGDITLTYLDLDRRANQLARHLSREGLRAGDVIGLLFDRSVESYVSLLAVLKINAAYVPLDPAFPLERINYIAGDAAIRAILTVSAFADCLRGVEAPLVFVDTAQARLAGENDRRLGGEEVQPPVNELCYIIYTSGSTGRPKGVLIEHASICNFVRVAAEIYGYRGDDRVYQGLTLAFDFSVEEIWVPLIAGATLVPNQTGSNLVGADLSTFLVEARISALCCVPTLLATIEEDLPHLRLLVVSGEACPHELVKRWHRSGRTLLNAYGPTEATVTATLAKPEPGKPVTIGKPLPTYSIVILRPEENRLLARGQVGEIGIAGPGLARGYLGRDDLTRAAFIDDFLGLPSNPSGRIYRTGDLGRINEDGEIEYHGRIDTQVKVRGYRIELTEIESTIMTLPEIAQAVVATHEPEPGLTELVAYYTLDDRSRRSLRPEDVWQALREMLPIYMVPTFYECLPSIPLLPSDKADRKRLPKPAGPRFQRASGDFVAPEGPLESALARLLADLLKVEQVSVTDHFFDDLGANSLLMARFSARIRKELGITGVSMRNMYLHPSIRGLSGLLAAPSQTSRPLRRNKPPHIASDLSYYGCGALQLLWVFLNAYLGCIILVEGFHWTMAAETMNGSYGRVLLLAIGTLVLSVAAPVALKWLLVGRWREEEFAVWSLKYLRFWIVKTALRANPMAALTGSPLYTAYLKALGARISWDAVIYSAMPVCTDLVTIGEGAIIRENALLSAYRAEANRIQPGRITLGKNTFVGEGTVLDIDTVMEDGSQLGHASLLPMGGRLHAGRRYHGSPARETEAASDLLPRGRVSVARRITFSLLQIASMIVGSAAFLFVFLLVGGEMVEPSAFDTAAPAAAELTGVEIALDVVVHTAAFYFGAVIVGLVLTILIPRVLMMFLEPGRTYRLYGRHYVVYRLVKDIGNSRIYNEMFGDSSLIVHYLRALGYRFPQGIDQTGTNFGQEQKHDVPALCEFGRGTMVSDGLSMVNVDVSTSTFSLSKVRIGANNFLGNRIFYPAQGRTGDNCLLATKVMVPVGGPLRENIGLLGSPCFEIPRSTRRDKQFATYADEQVRKQRLKLKNRSNALTLLYYLLSGWGTLALWVVVVQLILFETPAEGPFWIAVTFLVAMIHTFSYLVLVDWASLGFKRLRPQYCSVYDDYFWRHERHWKMISPHWLNMLDGTPFKTLMWWAMGVRVGRKVFDDGCSIPEKTLVSIGDYCTLGQASLLQGHSLEDGAFKADYIVIGDGCTIGANALIHYGVFLEDHVSVEPDSFVMKGERPTTGSCWRGNPAQELDEEEASFCRPAVTTPA